MQQCSIRKSDYGLFGVGLLLLSFVFYTGCTHKTDMSKKMGAVERQDVVQRVSLNGTLRGLRQTQIQPAYSGYVGKLYVSVGEKVKAGQPLVRITQTINQPLSEVFAIQAPFAGTVTQILKREGEYVTGGGDSSSGAILVLNDLREMWLDVTIPEVDVAKVSVDLSAQIRVNAMPGKKYNGVVKTLSLSPRQSQDRWDRGRVEYPAEILITDPDEALRPGLTVVADVISAKAEGVLAVKHEYLRKDEKGYFVLDEKGTEHRVEQGISNEVWVEMKKGVNLGMKIQMVDFGQL